MVRGRSLVARLMLLVLCGTCLLLAVDPLVHWAIVRSGMAVTGARVEFDTMQASWGEKSVVLRGFRASDPHLPSRTILQADLIKLQLDARALARRQVRIPRAQISGLYVTTDSRRPGILESSDGDGYAAELSERFLGDAGQWLDTAAQQLSEQLVAQLNLDGQLDRWPTEYEALELQATEIKDRIAALHEKIAQMGQNPLRNSLSYEMAGGQLDQLARELQEVRGHAQRLHQQILLDCQSMADNWRLNADEISEKLAVETLDADGLSEYLLGPEIAEQISMLTQWLRWGRQCLPSLQAETSLNRRGVRVVLPGMRPQPDILIDTLVLHGQAIVADQPLQIEGTVNGLSSQLSYCDKPAEVVIQTVGEAQLLIQAQLTGTSPHNHDRVVVNCPNWGLGERTLGDASQLALKVAPSNAHFWLSVDVDGDLLAGEIVIKQEVARLQPIMSQLLQTTPVSSLVVEAATKVSSIHSQIELSGTLDKPSWKMHSNLGHELVQHLEQSLQTYLLAQQRNESPAATSADGSQHALIAGISDRHGDLLANIDAAAAAVAVVTDRVAAARAPLRH